MGGLWWPVISILALQLLCLTATNLSVHTLIRLPFRVLCSFVWRLALQYIPEHFLINEQLCYN